MDNLERLRRISYPNLKVEKISRLNKLIKSKRFQRKEAKTLSEIPARWF